MIPVDNAATIQELRDRGLYPFIQHLRERERVHPGKFDSTERLSARGGRTIVRLYDAGEHKQYVSSPVEGAVPEPVAQGFAICHPRDNYNRKLGLHIALSRALVDLDTPKREHELVTADDAKEILEGVEESIEVAVAS